MRSYDGEATAANGWHASIPSRASRFCPQATTQTDEEKWRYWLTGSWGAIFSSHAS